MLGVSWERGKRFWLVKIAVDATVCLYSSLLMSIECIF